MNSPRLVPLSKYAQITKLAGYEYTKHFDYKVGGEIIALRSLNIRNGQIDLSDVHTMPREVSDALPRSKLRRGDIVLGYVGSKLGNLALIEHDNRFHLAPNVALIRPLPGVNPHFLLMFMQAPYYQSQLWSLASSTGQPALSMASLRRSEVWLPEANEQRRIAEILGAWERAIETVEALITNARAQKRALMQSLLTGKRRLPGFSAEWKSVDLKSMGKTSSGGTPDSDNDAYWNGDILWTTPTDITALDRKYITDTKRKISAKGLANCSAKLLPPGTLLVCTRATIGDMAIATSPISTNQGFKNLTPNAAFVSEFLFHLFGFHKHIFVRYACGSTFLELSKLDFERRSFLVPERKEQQAIANILDDADLEIETFVAEAETLHQEKSALMQQLLTGKRRVAVDLEDKTC